MLWLAVALFAQPAHAEDLTILVGPEVREVGLTCGSDTFKKSRSDGTRTGDGQTAIAFPIRPGRDCQIILVNEVPGSFEQLGTWACTNTGCRQIGGGKGSAISAGPGELAVLLDQDITNTQLELTCTDGTRLRTTVEDHVGRFNGVSSGVECTLNFKAGPPLKFTPITAGAWQCHLVSGTAVCMQ